MKLTGKQLSRLAAAVLFCTVAGSAFADEATERRLGDNAFFAGDYRNAAAFYESAMVLSDTAGQTEVWAENALKLGYARFYDGDLAGARKILAEFRRRQPGRSAGTLPGDLLAASGKSDEAEKFYQTLIAAGDSETAAAAAMSRGYLKLRLGDFAGALNCFQNLAKTSPQWAQNARWAIIYTLIRQNKISPAMIELGKVPPAEQGEPWQLLRWLAALSSGNLQEVEKPLLDFLAQQPVRPQPRIFEVVLNAAQLAALQKQRDKSVTLYEKALEFAPDDEARQEILRRLINLYAQFDLVKAKACAENYARLFPAAADRAAIQIAVGKLLLQHGKSQEALELFQRTAGDRRLPLTDRLNAAAGGTVAAEKLQRKEAAQELYRMLISESPNAAASFQWRCAYIQYLLRSNEIVAAVKAVETALSSAGKNEKEALLTLQLEAVRRSGNEKEIRSAAQTLLASDDPTRVALAHFVIAETLEKNGHYAEARKAYLDASSPKGGQERPARFKAAQMAVKCEDMETAAKEFADFARRYPQAESAPAALYAAINAFRELGAPEKAAELQRTLRERYPRSQARIAADMLSCENRAENGDAAGAAADLIRMLDELQGHPELAPAMLMSVRFLQQAGEYDRLLAAAEKLQKLFPNTPETAEALLLAGNSEFNRSKYENALQYFQLAEKNAQGVLLPEIISGRIVDTELVLYGTSSPAKLADTLTRCQRLFTTSKNPVIRLQSRYKYGMIKERSGDADGAVAAYEQLLYDAEDLKKQGFPLSTEWCVRAANAALRLLAERKRSDTLQRGSRLIDRYEALELSGSGENFSQLRREFRKKIIHQTPRR